MMQDAGCTMFLSGGGARPAMHSGTMCGKQGGRP
jgi:flavin-dependent dehydrogenase